MRTRARERLPPARRGAEREASAERDRDLDKALFAVGQVADANACVLGEAERGEQVHALGAHIGHVCLPHAACAAATPRRSATASATLSITARRRKSALIWNVRPSPRFTRFACPWR